MVQLACTILNNRFQCYIYSFFYYSLNWKLYHGLAFVLADCSILHTLVCNKTFKVQSGDWIHAV